MEENKNNNANFLIECLWVIENNSGLCIFEENYVDFTKDGIPTDLVSNFLSALLTFAGETFTEEIQYIKFSNRKILFKFSDQVLFAIAISDKETDRDDQITKVVNNIVNRFNEKFHMVFENDNWSGNISMFNNFSEDLKEMLKMEPLKVKHFQMFDFKGNFKKIETFILKQRAIILKHKKKIQNLIYHKKQK